MPKLLDFPIKPSPYAIVLNGQSNRSLFLEKNLTSYQMIVVCDGAWNELSTVIKKQANNIPLVLLGDGDSIINPPKQFIHINEQNTTDFEKALNHLKASYPEDKIIQVDVFQSNGKAMDHALANLALVAKYTQFHMFEFQLVSDDYWYQYINVTTEEKVLITQAQNKTVSILPFPKITIRGTKGFEYDVDDQTFTLLTSQSVRNKITDDQAKLYCLGSGFFMFSW